MCCHIRQACGLNKGFAGKAYSPRNGYKLMRRFAVSLLFIPVLFVPASCLAAARLEVLPEFLRLDPFGSIVGPDQAAADLRSVLITAGHKVILAGARGGYVSFHLVAEIPKGGPYSLEVALADPAGKVQTDLFREWFHFDVTDKRYYPDALVPVQQPYKSRIPEPDNQVPQQTAQAFWVDVYIAPDAAPGRLSGKARLKSAAGTASLPLELTILECAIPKNDVVALDHNSYGSSWLAEQYSKMAQAYSGNWFESDQFFQLIHAYHRIFYEHRGIFHQLGYGHSGKVGPEFAPALRGSGRTKHIANWDLFDRHYAALFNGSAFSGTRRGPRPIPYVYLPLNPEWPASYEFWGEPGYEMEFVNVVSAMERHFREKGWTNTRFEVFFNHKKRYKGFPWDGDEVRFSKDLSYFLEYGRLLKRALPADTPVHFVFRADVSWDMEQQFKVLEGIVNMWVCGGSILSFYQDAPKMLHDRGDIVFYYGGPPSVTEAASTITQAAFRAWLWGVDGYVHWLTVSLGPDPWFQFDGGHTTLAYPGERFGIEGPIPSVRLKIQRNGLQDLDLLTSLAKKRPPDSLKSETARLYNGTTLNDWWTPRPALAELPSDQWLGTAIDDAYEPTRRRLSNPEPAAWNRVHQFALQLASEEK